MACNGVLTPPSPLAKVTPPVLKCLNPPVLKLFTLPLRLETAASAFFTHGYFQQAHVHVPEAIIAD